MVGIIFYRRVVLEDAEGLLAKVQQLDALLSALGWNTSHRDILDGSRRIGGKVTRDTTTSNGNRLLAVCLEPSAKAMLAALHQAAEGGGELRANFQVRRSSGAAFWEAKQQAEEAGLIQTKGSPPPLGPKCFKVFPSFVDEWANGGSGGSGGESGKTRVEAGEGHGPRKEFFALAAASMTGGGGGGGAQSGALSDDSPVATPSAISLDQKQRGDQRPQLFVFNRSAGAFWYNSNLARSPELQDAFRFAGWLMGQSLLNRAPMGVPLAPTMMQQLLLDGGIDAFQADLGALEVSGLIRATGTCVFGILLAPLYSNLVLLTRE